MRIRTFAAFAIVASLFSFPASAAEVVVEMLTRDSVANQNNVFKPLLIKINKGDSVKWVAKQSGHNVAFLQGGIPAGVPLVASPIGKDFTYKFDKPGVYLYKCTPHFGLGMVGLIVVGNDKSNLAAVKAVYVPPMAKKQLEPAFKELEKP